MYNEMPPYDGQEKREYPRYQPTPRLSVKLNSSYKRKNEVYVQDISKSGAYLEGVVTNKENIDIIIQIPKNRKPIIKKSNLVRVAKKDNGVAIRFESILSNSELASILRGEEDIMLKGDSINYEFAKSDRFEVFRENQNIKTCSSNMFSWAIGLIIPLTLALWALLIKGQLPANISFPSMMAILLIFAVAVFSNIEKARAINKREGLMATLDFYLNKQNAPYDYRGWINLKHCFAECAARLRGGICPRRFSPNSKETCIHIGEKNASIILNEKRVIPFVLDSWISLTAVCYAIVLLSIIVLFCASLVITFKDKHELWLIILLFIIALPLGLIVWRYPKIVLALSIGIISTYFMESIYPTAKIYFYFTCSATGLFLGAFSCILIRQVISLRRGKSSFEAYTHAWFEILDNCVFLPDEASWVNRDKDNGKLTVSKRMHNLLNRILKLN